MKIHNSCYTLPLSNFIRCVVDGDLTALVIDGEPTEAELIAAWDSIYQEYIGMTAAALDKYAVSLSMQIEAISCKIEVIEEAVFILRAYRSDELVKILHQFGYRFPFNADDEKAYHADLDRVISRAKSLLIERERMIGQLNSAQKGSSTGITRDYFETYLAVLSEYVKYHLNEDQITVSRYAKILDRYVRHCEQLKQQEHGQKRRQYRSGNQ